MSNSVHVQYGYGFITESPEEEDFSEVFKAMGIEIDPEDPYDCWYEIEKKFPGVVIRPFGHYDYYYGYFICAKSTAQSGWGASLSLDGLPIPTMDEISALASVLGYFYPNFDNEIKHRVVGAYS